MDNIINKNKSLTTISSFIAIIVSLFHLLNTSGLIAMSSMTIRVVHLTAMIIIMYLKGEKGEETASGAHTLYRVIMSVITLACGIYLLYRWEAIVSSGGAANNTDVIVGILTILVVLDATRKSAGMALSIIAAVFLAYPFIGKYLPGILRAKTYSVSRIFTFLYTTTEGIYGIPISVSATYIILFCIYGAFLKEFGAGEFLFKLSSVLTKKFVAATAKTSIIFSALIGLISGSAAGNVAITGSLTIPTMIKSGYKSDQAAAISAVSSVGGQIMPPIMGAAAFMMAELIGVPYSNIMKVAILPAVLYFISIFIIVDLEAKKQNIDMGNKETGDTFGSIMKEGWFYLLPIASLIVMMVLGYSPFKAALVSIVALIAVYLPSQVVSGRVTIKEFGIKTLGALKGGAFDTSPIAIACAAAGIIAGVLSITGLGSKLATVIIQISGENILVALILTMFVSLILGMGLPTTAAYLVLASVVAPALVKLGLSVISAHMFVFFFGCISTITPPVALASYVAAGIAGSDLNNVSWTAFKYGLVSFILPFMFVFGDGLLMVGTPLIIAQTFIMAVIGVFCVAASLVGYFNNVKLNNLQRVIIFIAGLLTIYQGILTDVAGLAIILAIYITTKRHVKPISRR